MTSIITPLSGSGKCSPRVIKMIGWGIEALKERDSAVESCDDMKGNRGIWCGERERRTNCQKSL